MAQSANCNPARAGRDQRDDGECQAGGDHRPTPGPVLANVPAEPSPERDRRDGGDKVDQDKLWPFRFAGSKPMRQIEEEQCCRYAIGHAVQEPRRDQPDERPVAG
jgi:hypothetical protein